MARATCQRIASGRILPIVLWSGAIVVGLSLLVWGSSKYVREHQWIRQAARTEGVVVELVRMKSTRPQSTKYYRPRVAFTAADGTQHVFLPRAAAGTKYSVGQRIQVAYDRTTYEGRILTFEERFGATVVFSAIGVGVVFAAVTFLIGMAMFPRVYPRSANL